jgi:hypothetical protein
MRRSNYMPLDLDIQLSIYELNILLLFSMDHETYSHRLTICRCHDKRTSNSRFWRFQNQPLGPIGEAEYAICVDVSGGGTEQAARSCDSHWRSVLLSLFTGQLYQCNRYNAPIEKLHCTEENCWTRTTSSGPLFSISVVIILTLERKQEMANFQDPRDNFKLSPCLDHLKIPSFFTLSPSYQFLAACMEY